MSNIKLENLEIDGFHLYQDKTNFNFGIDAVLLANFALRESNLVRASSANPFTRVSCASPKSVRASYASPKTIRASYASPTKICDLCSGTLPIPLIIYAKSRMGELCEPIGKSTRKVSARAQRPSPLGGLHELLVGADSIRPRMGELREPAPSPLGGLCEPAPKIHGRDNYIEVKLPKLSAVILKLKV